MRGQLAESAQELELSERPWIDAEISLNGPFTFDPNGANIPLKIVLQNSGRSPAQKTAVDVEPLLGFMGNPVDFYRKQACRQAEALGSFGESLFPGRNSEYDINAAISYDMIKKSNFNAKERYPDARIKPGDVVIPDIVVCISYRAPFNAEFKYYTGYLMELLKLDDKGRQVSVFGLGQQVDRTHLRLRLAPQHGITAE